MTPEELIEAYLQSLTEKERMAYLIAKSHLGTSFNLQKSNGFLAFLKNNQPTTKPSSS